MEKQSNPRQFDTTLWSMVRAVRTENESGSPAINALESLCRAYWYPLYAFVRARGYSADDAQDLTQAFFARMLETGGFDAADPGKGRFRSYLLGAMKHFLASEWRREHALKRGGKSQFIELDALQPESRYQQDPRQSENADQRYDREWALETIDTALNALRSEMRGAKRANLFEKLKGFLTGDTIPDQQSLAKELNMNDGALRAAIHRMRARYRDLLKQTISETVTSQEELVDEMNYLIAALRGY